MLLILNLDIDTLSRISSEIDVTKVSLVNLWSCYVSDIHWLNVVIECFRYLKTVLVTSSFLIYCGLFPTCLSLFCFGQSYNRDMFLFMYILLIITSTITSLKKHPEKSAISGKSIMYLNRNQTEEWRGWMQVGDLTSLL